MIPRRREPATESAAHRLEIGAQAESALRTIRVTLAIMACLLLAALRPELNQLSLARLLASIAAIAVTTFVLNLISFRASANVFWKAVSQIADTAAVLGMVVLLDEALAHQGWVLIIIPMVSATVRLGAVATLLTWIVSSALFVGAAMTELIMGFSDRALVLRIPGLLLAVAISVSVLARWMREGWEIQNALTDSIATRERRLATIENAARALHRLDQSKALEVCASSALDLGFEATTINTDGAVALAVGRRQTISRGVPKPKPGQVLTTIWTRPDGPDVFSVAINEPQSGRTVVGWSTNPPSADQAQALGTLVSHTSTAIETAAMMASLDEASRHDSLTGLLNRRGAAAALEDASHQQRLAAAFVDLDDLKKINDQHGHSAGDKAICAIAQRLKAAAGPHALVARFGGDEFVVLIPNGSLEQVTAIGQSLLDAASDPVALGPLNVKLGVSIGVAAESAPADLATLLERADEAVYRAKSLGKGQLVALEANGFRTIGPRSSTQIVVHQSASAAF